jgi:hypothetical protein
MTALVENGALLQTFTDALRYWRKEARDEVEVRCAALRLHLPTDPRRLTRTTDLQVMLCCTWMESIET